MVVIQQTPQQPAPQTSECRDVLIEQLRANVDRAVILELVKAVRNKQDQDDGAEAAMEQRQVLLQILQAVQQLKAQQIR